jgi:hypothetical protein
LLLVLIHNPHFMWSGVVIHVERTTYQWMIVKCGATISLSTESRYICPFIVPLRT